MEKYFDWLLLGTNIRNPLAHVPLSLTDTCQL
jgi:hypothetical protein